MAIVIRNGQPFRIQFSYTGNDYHVTRYEPLNDPDGYFYVIDDNVNDLAMECDGEHTVALERDLEQRASGALSEADFEAKLRRMFEEVLAMEAVLRRGRHHGRSRWQQTNHIRSNRKG